MDGRTCGTVSCTLNLRLVTDKAALPVPAKLRYDPADPFAVHATFHTGETTVSWVFARELLARGVDEPTGEGDVRVWPPRCGRPTTVFVRLSSPDGAAVLEAPRRALVDFLARTYAAVPEGSEEDLLDVDGALARLLA